jgi:hypothetical protein
MLKFDAVPKHTPPPTSGQTPQTYCQTFTESLRKNGDCHSCRRKVAADTQYTAIISTGATDLAGNPLAADYVWILMTGDVVAQGEPVEGVGEDMTVAVPNIDDMTEDEAVAALEAAGFAVLVESRCPVGCNPPPTGTIIDQDPPSGTNVPAGSQITITVSDCRKGLLNLGILGDIFAGILAFFGLVIFRCMFDCDSPTMLK